MNSTIYFIIAVILFVFGLVYFCNQKSFRKFHVWLVIIAYIIIVSITYNFVIASGGFTNKINQDYWSAYGSFIGAFLLAATLFFQIRSSRRQQVEAKFFELVKYYRDNISEMRIRNPFYYEIVENDKNRSYEERFVEGRRVMKIIFDQYKVAYGICDHQKTVPEDDLLSILTKESHYINHFIPKRPPKSRSICTQQKRRFIANEIAYLITFWGVSRDSFSELEDKLLRQFILDKNSKNKNSKYLPDTELIRKITQLIAVYECKTDPKGYSVMINNHLKLKPKRDFIECIKAGGLTKFFGGHQYQLGHYYRHLYQAVKFIDKQPKWLFSKNEKYDYIKTLRAQMSNYEQALLFINSLTIMGRDWEYSNKDGKCLISEYNLIKNLPKKFIPNMQPQDYYPDVDFEWQKNNSKKKV